MAIIKRQFYSQMLQNFITILCEFKSIVYLESEGKLYNLQL